MCFLLGRGYLKAYRCAQGRGGSKFRVFIAYVLYGWSLRAHDQSVVLKEGIFEHHRKNYYWWGTKHGGYGFGE